MFCVTVGTFQVAAYQIAYMGCASEGINKDRVNHRMKYYDNRPSGSMAGRALYEIVVFSLSLLIYPTLLIAGRMFHLESELRIFSAPTPQGLLVKSFVPYLIIMGLRAAYWSNKSLQGRRWANVYFFAMFAVGVVWFAWDVVDLFYFMYMMGDVPEELRQLFEIEWFNILATTVCLWLANHSLRESFRADRELRSRASQ